jgi:protein disulfide-isomerase A6
MAAPEFEQAASILSGIVNIGAVDMTTDPGAGSKYGISGYPTIKLFGPNKDKPIDFSSSDRTFNKFV